LAIHEAKLNSRAWAWKDDSGLPDCELGHPFSDSRADLSGATALALISNGIHSRPPHSQIGRSLTATPVLAHSDALPRKATALRTFAGLAIPLTGDGRICPGRCALRLGCGRGSGGSRVAAD
jgi:hypothetical protein